MVLIEPTNLPFFRREGPRIGHVIGSGSAVFYNLALPQPNFSVDKALPVNDQQIVRIRLGEYFSHGSAFEVEVVIESAVLRLHRHAPLQPLKIKRANGSPFNTENS